MTDANRLRAAADILAGPEGVTRSLLVIGHRGLDTDEIAALLRAVADEVTGWPDGHVSDNGPRHGYGECCQECGEPWPCWPSTVHAAAGALASVVLGDNDD